MTSQRGSSLIWCRPPSEQPLKFFGTIGSAVFLWSQLLNTFQRLGLLASENFDEKNVIGAIYNFTSFFSLSLDLDVVSKTESAALFFMISIVPLLLIKMFHDSLDLFEEINTGEEKQKGAWKTVTCRTWTFFIFTLISGVPTVIFHTDENDIWAWCMVVTGGCLLYAVANFFHSQAGQALVRNEYKSTYPMGRSYTKGFLAVVIYFMGYLFTALTNLWVKLTFFNEEDSFKPLGIIAVFPLIYLLLLIFIIQVPGDYAELEQGRRSCSAWLVKLTFWHSRRYKYFGKKDDDKTLTPSIVRPNFWLLGTAETIEKIILVVVSNFFADKKVDRPELKDFSGTLSSTGVLLFFSLGIWLFRPYCNGTFNAINIIPRFVNVVLTLLSVAHSVSLDNEDLAENLLRLLVGILSCLIILWVIFAWRTEAIQVSFKSISKIVGDVKKLHYYHKFWLHANTPEAVQKKFGKRKHKFIELDWDVMTERQRLLLLCSTSAPSYIQFPGIQQLKFGYNASDTKYSEDLVNYGFYSLPELKIFKVKDVGLELQDIHALINCPSFLALSPHLCKLSIRKNPIENEGCMELVRKLRQKENGFKNLVTLTLTACGNLRIEALTEVAEFMKDSERLRCLYLDENQIEFEALQPIINILRTGKGNVSTISLAFNHLKDNALRGISETFKSEGNMSNYFLWENDFTEKAKEDARIEAKRYKKNVFFSIKECEESFSV